MKVQDAYNQWAALYDTSVNKTRDLEAAALRSLLSGQYFKRCLEIGCGTGKNTDFLTTITDAVTAVDFSESMLAQAKIKMQGRPVTFYQADITKQWNFGSQLFFLITFSLVLEHIEDVDDIFSKAAAVAAAGAKVYVGELHPFKQYLGSKARFETPGGEQVVPCFQHHVSDFTQAAKKAGFAIESIREWFDEDKAAPPRILSMIFTYEA